MSPFDLQSTYVCLAPDGSAKPIEVTADFWSSIDQRPELREGRLVAVFESDGDWPHWEMHPHGDELLVLLEGSMTFIFEHAGVQRSLELREGQSVLVPPGTWHRALVPAPSKLLAITYGRDTQHRPR
jgi:mannose-6-phosphate isomerase-like protein (cupin superfamily)